MYNVSFPMLEKGEVNGHNCHPVYKYMRENSSLQGGDISWNFAKFLISGDGKVYKYYEPAEEPNTIIPDIEKCLKMNWTIDRWLNQKSR